MQTDPDSLDREEYEIIVCSLMTWIESSVLCEQFQSDKDIGSLLGRLQSWITVNSVVRWVSCLHVSRAGSVQNHLLFVILNSRSGSPLCRRAQKLVCCICGLLLSAGSLCQCSASQEFHPV